MFGARRIDLAACAIMAHSVAATADPGRQLYWYEAAGAGCSLPNARCEDHHWEL
jgi:hypothetical protein